MKVPYPKNIHNMFQGPPNPGLGQSKYKLRIFLKRTLGISEIIFIQGSYEYLASLESKIRRCPFFWYFKKAVWDASSATYNLIYTTTTLSEDQNKK